MKLLLFQGKKGAILELDSARVALDRAHARRRNAILFARSKGATWREIGGALQMSASGASALVTERKSVAPPPPPPTPDVGLPETRGSAPKPEPLPTKPDPALIDEVERV